MEDAFSRCHPVVNFSYFCLVIGFSMFLTHPVCQLLSLACALCYSIYLNGRRAVRFTLFGMLPLLLLAFLLNPLFNHEGATILRYLPDGNPLTLESMLFGLSASVMLVTVITWFSCYNTVMTSDKFLYLFGRVIPALSLLLSMTLRFVPRFTAQVKRLTAAQRMLGNDPAEKGVLQRVRRGAALFSAMVTWALESAVTTADSMKSRGYGLRGRTAFSHYRFSRRDGALLVLFGLLFACLIAGAVRDDLFWQYYPVVAGRLAEPPTLVIYIAYLLLCIAPLILDWREDRKWRALRSGI